MGKERVVVLFVVAAAAALSGGACEATTYKTEKIINGSDIAIFLLAGQSNMVGRGGTMNKANRWDGLTPSLCKPNRKILRLNNEMQWEEAREPLHKSISLDPCLVNEREPGVGPGMPFANTLLAINPAIGTIGLVPCAVGNTEIYKWRRGDCLYNRLLTRTRAALRARGSLRGMLWYQGENDCKPGLSDVYEDKLKAFFIAIRSDLMMTSLPIIQVALDLSEKDPIVKKVRSAQLKIKLPNMRSVDALGLPLNADNLHLTTDSQVKLGSKLAQEFFKYFE